MPDEQTDFRLRLPALVAYRAAASKRRATAFCDAPEYVMGTEVKPLTPATFSMLLAIGNRFVCGGQPMEGDVRNYLWFHSHLYANCGAKDWPKRKKKALCAITFHLAQPWRKWVGIKQDVWRYSSFLVLAIAEIRSLVNDAFADASRGSGRPGAPLACMEAQLIHEFASAYQWPADRTRHTPLRELFQLHRCIRAGRGETVSDDGEDEIKAAHIRERLAKIQAEKSK